MRILIADDHAIVRRGLRQIVEELAERPEVCEASNAREALETVQKTSVDLVILDMSLPDKSGLDVLKEVKSLKPKLPVLILSMHPEDQFALRALKAGAAGYMTKESAAEELAGAITKVLAGGHYVSSSMAERMAGELSGSGHKTPQESLSDREYQILCMIASGKTVSEIAAQLHLSVKTVSTYRTRVLEKMNMKTNAELTRYAIENRLV